MHPLKKMNVKTSTQFLPPGVDLRLLRTKYNERAHTRELGLWPTPTWRL
jgi:hypothetical protein